MDQSNRYTFSQLLSTINDDDLEHRLGKYPKSDKIVHEQRERKNEKGECVLLLPVSTALEMLLRERKLDVLARVRQRGLLKGLRNRARPAEICL